MKNDWQNEVSTKVEKAVRRVELLRERIAECQRDLDALDDMKLLELIRRAPQESAHLLQLLVETRTELVKARSEGAVVMREAAARLIEAAAWPTPYEELAEKIRALTLSE